MTQQKKPTIIDVAKRAGVSKSSVSLVLRQSDKVSDKTKQKVNQAMAELGYVYNRDAASLRQQSSQLVAVLANDLANPYLAQLLVPLQQELEALGFFVMIFNIDEDLERQQKTLQALLEYKVAAIVITPAAQTQAENFELILNQGIPLIQLMRQVDHEQVPAVLADNYQGMYQAGLHLIEHGHTQIAFVGGDLDLSDYQQRLAGAKAALQQHQLTFNPSWICATGTNRASGREAVRTLFSQQIRPTAILCFSDIVAYGVLSELREQGLHAGKDIAVVGFDNLSDSKLLSPPLSTVNVETKSLAQKTCHLLTHMLTGQKITENTFFIPASLLVRESSTMI
ncbi:MAG: LacI family DNA-binding transcriptional regulator [Vibrio sp.]